MPLEWLRRLVKSVQQLLRIRWVRWGAQLVVVVVSLAYLSARVNGVSDFVRSRPIGYIWLVWALVLAVVDVFVGALAWCLILRGFSQPVGLLDGTKVHIYTNLAKYVPGYAWQMVGKAYSTSQIGVSPRIIAAAMAFELVDLVVLGLGLSLSINPQIGLLPGAQAAGWTVLLRAVGLVILAAAFLAVPIASAFLKRRLGTMVQGPLFEAIVLSLGGWLLMGLTFWLVGLAVIPLSISVLPLFINALIVSVLAGLAVVFVPGGIGVRESIMVLILSPIISAPAAIIVAALSRVILVMSDFSAALVLRLVQGLVGDRPAFHNNDSPPA